MYTLEVLWSSLALIESVLIEVPELAEETVTAIDTIRIPRLRLLYRTQEHLIETQGISAVFLNDHIRIDHIKHRFRHLLNSPSALVLAILENKLSIVIFRTPSLESLDVENISRNNVHIHVNRCRGVLILQTKANELTLIGTLVFDTINEVTAPLNHTLIDEFLEGLVLARIARVIEELVPETRVNQVTSSVFSTTNIKVDIAPIFISITTDEGLLILWVHIAQIVS